MTEESIRTTERAYRKRKEEAAKRAVQQAAIAKLTDAEIDALGVRYVQRSLNG